MLAVRNVLLRCSPTYSAAEEGVKVVLKPLAKDAAVASAVADLAITCFYAMIFAYPIALLLNVAFRDRVFLRRAINDAFEALLHDAQRKESTLAVSMADGKVYVGFVVNAFLIPTMPRETFSLLPLMSALPRQSYPQGNVYHLLYKDLR